MSTRFIGELAVEARKPGETESDLLILLMAKGTRRLPAEWLEALGGDQGAAALLLASGDFRGETAELALAYGAGARHPRVLFCGTGAASDGNGERLRAVTAAAARRARDLGVARALIALPPIAAAPSPASPSSPARNASDPAASALDALSASAEGALLGTYQFLDFKQVDPEKNRAIGRLAWLLPVDADLPAAQAALERARVRAEAVNFARDLGNAPGNEMTPTRLAEEAAEVAKESGLECTILEREECEKLGMGAFLSVARGSEQPPKFIVLEYDSGRAGAPLIALVGKAVTFDSGGISLKPGLKMDEMKFDMCGGAAVLAVMKALRALSIPVNVVAAIPATENLPSGRATKPGDVVRSLIGKTIEVLNTDAEGRLILADALGWVVRNRKPEAVIDIATLTGAVIIALGHYGAAVLSNHEDLAERIRRASETSGDRSARLPIWEEFSEHLKGETADLKNIGDANAGAGTIAGGTFLREFVEGTPWAHIDIAGTAWWDKDRPHMPKGASGYGVRLLLDLLEGYAR